MNHHFLKSVPVYACAKCGHVSTKSWEDGYGQFYCVNCENEVDNPVYRDANYVTVAVYEVTRAYGGPEEGGWWYYEGRLVPGTQRSFLVEDAPQADVYHLTLLHRYREDESWMRYQDVRYHVRVWAEQEAPAKFPSVRPRYH